MFRRGVAVIDGETVFGTATYCDEDQGLVLFRRHSREVAISPGHAPLPDAGAYTIPAAEFVEDLDDSVKVFDWSRT